MRQYYTPRLLTRRVAPVIGNKLPNLPSIAGLNRIQPEVEVIDVQLDAANADTVQVTVTVKPGGDGSPSRDLRLFRDGQLVRTVSGNLRQRRYKFTGVRLAHHGPKQEFCLVRTRLTAIWSKVKPGRNRIRFRRIGRSVTAKFF